MYVGLTSLAWCLCGLTGDAASARAIENSRLKVERCMMGQTYRCFQTPRPTMATTSFIHIRYGVICSLLRRYVCKPLKEACPADHTASAIGYSVHGALNVYISDWLAEGPHLNDLQFAAVFIRRLEFSRCDCMIAQSGLAWHLLLHYCASLKETSSKPVE